MGALIVLLVAGCGDGESPESEDRQRAGIHKVARAVVELPGVTCAEGVLDTQGLPSAPLGSLALLVTTNDLDTEAQLDVYKEAARLVWASDLAVTSLAVSGPAGVPGVGDAIGASGTNARPEDLEAAFGPRPPLPSPPLPSVEDPGNPPC